MNLYLPLPSPLHSRVGGNLIRSWRQKRFPPTREWRQRQKLNTAQILTFWIPAYAGMTAVGAGEFGGGAGITAVGRAGNWRRRTAAGIAAWDRNCGVGAGIAAEFLSRENGGAGGNFRRDKNGGGENGAADRLIKFFRNKESRRQFRYNCGKILWRKKIKIPICANSRRR